jgi:Cyclic nucleotide-binding domain
LHHEKEHLQLLLDVSKTSVSSLDLKDLFAEIASCRRRVIGQEHAHIALYDPATVKLSSASREGKVLVLKIVGPGEVMGLSAVISGEPYEITAETLGPCLVNFVERDGLLRLMVRKTGTPFRPSRQPGISIRVSGDSRAGVSEIFVGKTSAPATFLGRRGGLRGHARIPHSCPGHS